ncbi:MAG: MmcB family DNA repair protein [Spirochaetes bacterium]|jgi:hypothetical protein|nr:MmcB family DNA repair protein [Spirochaetota bacterium]
MKTSEIEMAMVRHLDARKNLIVPNVYWGMFDHELDLCVVSKAGYITEIEIKVSLSDLKKDRAKKHLHYDKKDRIKYLYFAIPAKLAKHIEHIPKNAGVYVVTTKGRVVKIASSKPWPKARALTIEERYIVARLGALRIWNLKERITEKEVWLQKLAKDSRGA